MPRRRQRDGDAGTVNFVIEADGAAAGDLDGSPTFAILPAGLASLASARAAPGLVLPDAVVPDPRFRVIAGHAREADRRDALRMLECRVK